MLTSVFNSGLQNATIRCSVQWASTAKRLLATTATYYARPNPPRPPLRDEGEFTEVFLKGSGPGGQKINKTSSAVQLKHLPTGLVLKVQETRSRSQNRKIAREKLAERVDVLERGPESRVAVIAEKKRKKKSKATRKSKKKYLALDAAKELAAEQSLTGDESINEEGLKSESDGSSTLHEAQKAPSHIP